MKFSKPAAAACIFAAALSLTACGDKGSSDTTTSSAAKPAASSAAKADAATPTAADLNKILAVATDPAATVDQKIKTVQGAETAPELFETMTKSKIDSGAEFQVVDPVLPGYTPNSVLATVNFTLPERPSQVADSVEFVNEGGNWKLSKGWACTLITNTVSPEKVPAMCQSEAPAGEVKSQ
ncbi:hypothetical protein [Corynebacterium epidermidicanis]|uniref:Low molecular weight antigen MTB12-like C-terminal domain-containing protein n=1 Tax=Corynebacterium epidermidicanis TaxID=1050174 RepID=A0A0G3GSF2_9CORY|nr:hypothetical protein [Corynebacterium epidermidicanis]AKK03505.1 hypothetical protein CEPID_08275 [Corynebacterium epidermidicanis]